VCAWVAAAPGDDVHTEAVIEVVRFSVEPPNATLGPASK
jgi:hypothetical protein